MNITYEYKLEPTKEQAQEMTHWLNICRGVWNYALAERRDWIKSRKCDINSCSIRQEYRPRFFIESQHKLKLLNRDVSRKQKGSKNQQKARVKVASLYEKIYNTRKHFHISVAHHLCDTAGMIFAEDLNLKTLAQGMLGKHCLDAGWGNFLDILAWVAFKRGVYFAKVDSKGTSQLCPMCDTRVPKDLSVRVHECACGYRTDRDVASSQVVLKRGLAAVGHTVKKSVEYGEATNPPVKQKPFRSDLGSPRYNALRV
ncbi:MAG: hypothetical protein NVSMB70_02030 [Chamaesiphon sp.]